MADEIDFGGKTLKNATLDSSVTGSGGGNPFDQNLNTTDNVSFNQVAASQLNATSQLSAYSVTCAGYAYCWRIAPYPINPEQFFITFGDNTTQSTAARHSIGSGPYSIQPVGGSNSASNWYSTINGGRSNSASGYNSAVGGGNSNNANGNYSVIAGGVSNNSSNYSAICGGSNNTASGNYSSVLGGQNNNTNTYSNAHIIGSNITADAADTTFVNSLKIVGTFNGVSYSGGITFPDGSTLTTALTGTLPSSANYNDLLQWNGSSWGGAAIPLLPSASASGQVLLSDNMNTWQASSAPWILDPYGSQGWAGSPNNGSVLAYSTSTNRWEPSASTSSPFTTGSSLNSIQSVHLNNVAGGQGSFIGGGGTHTTGGNYNTISGGSGNSTGSADNSTVGGGMSNASTGTNSTISGGYNNDALVDDSTVSGGNSNSASGAASTVGGGANNEATGTYSAVSGGTSNTASGNYSTVGGGRTSTASGNYSIITGGSNNIASGPESAVSGGTSQIASGKCSAVSGGQQNTASGDYSGISAGFQNSTIGRCSTVSGGYTNSATWVGATVGGGYFNTASGSTSTVGGGHTNHATQTGATVSGGYVNTASGDFSVVSGGRGNTASGDYSVVCGGGNSMGTSNVASGDYSSVLGGQSNDTNNKVNAHIIGSSITADADNTTFVNNLKIVSGGALTFPDGTTQTTAPAGGAKSLLITTGDTSSMMGMYSDLYNPTTPYQGFNHGPTWGALSVVPSKWYKVTVFMALESNGGQGESAYFSMGSNGGSGGIFSPYGGFTIYDDGGYVAWDSIADGEAMILSGMYNGTTYTFAPQTFLIFTGQQETELYPRFRGGNSVTLKAGSWFLVEQLN